MVNNGNIGYCILPISCPNGINNTPNVLDSIELRERVILFDEEEY